MEDQAFFLVCGSILAVLICLGLVGNIISVITWRAGRRCRNLPGATFFTALSLSDTLALVTAGINYDVQLLFGINFWDFNSVTCMLFHTIWHLIFLVSTWIIVFLSIQRAMALSQSLRVTPRTKRTKEKLAVFMLIAVALVVNLPFMFGAKMMPKNLNAERGANENTSDFGNKTAYLQNLSQRARDSQLNVTATEIEDMVCGADPDSFYSKYENEFHNWFIDFGLLFLAPTSILTICNVVILVTVCRHRRNFALKNSRLNGRGSNALTARVVMLSVVQCISVGPFSIASLIPGAMPDNQAVDLVFYDRLFTVTVMIWYLNNCVNFILYNMFGQAFRRDCADLLSRFFRCHRRRKLSTGSEQFNRVSFRATFTSSL